MQIKLELEHHFRLVAEDGRSILLQSDWDYPKIASLFGYVPCFCGQTDGTIQCAHRTPGEMIDEAKSYLLDRVYESVDDPGYF